MGTVRIEDRHDVTEIEGRLLGRYVTTRGPRSVRWVEMGVYKLDNGGYVAHRIGRSLVYHQASGGCTTVSDRLSGDPALPGELPGEAASCDRCQPPWPEDLESDEEVRFEFDRHTFNECDEPADVVRKLTSLRDRRSGIRSHVVSDPVRELLAICAAEDPEFAQAPKPVQRIG